MLEHLTDDQLALLGCAGAILASVAVVSLSYWLGGARQQVQRRLATAAAATPSPALNPAPRTAPIAATHRRAA